MENRSPRSRAQAPHAGRFSTSFCALVGAAAVGGLIGCAPPPDEIEETNQPGLSVNGLSVNGLSVNGLSVNGLSVNGLSVNGLSVNGLSVNGLSVNGAFSDWFNLSDGGDLALHDMTMKYVIRCALSEGRTASFTDKNGLVHSWAGALGLADSWDQNPPTEDQMKWVSACLLAHVNSAIPAPKSIQVSVRGSAPTLVGTTLEKNVVTSFDGAFFGDLFGSNPKRYLCSPTWSPPVNYLTTLLSDWGRQCFFSAEGCGAFYTRVDCNTACTAMPANSDYSFGPTCTVDGVTYPAINAYVPKFKKSGDWTLVGVNRLSCSSCLEGKMMDNFTSSTYAQVAGWTATSGLVYLDVRYQNNTTATKNLRLQINGAYVMNGSSQNWTFAPTGSGWAVRSIPVNLPVNAMVKLIGPTSGMGPRVEVVSLRVQ